jgi:hypothetical protein
MLQVHELEIEKLHPWENNPRKNDQAVEAVAESIRSFGFNVPIICDHNMSIVAGHTRWKAALKLGLEKVPVIMIEMTDTKRRAFAITDNKTAEIADWDFPRLKELLEELRSEDIDIKNMGFSDEEIEELLNPPITAHHLYGQISKGYVEGIHEIDSLKLAYRLESLCHCQGRNLAIDLFSGKGQLSFWYERLFDDVIRVDKVNYEGIDYCQNAGIFLKGHISQYMNFNFIDFDDEGCPGKELQLLFSLIEGKKEPFILCLTDGMGLHFKLRGKINLYDYYLFGKNEMISITSDSQYRDFDLYVKHLIDTLCKRHGFVNKIINWYRGAEGSVIYACLKISPQGALI